MGTDAVVELYCNDSCAGEMFFRKAQQYCYISSFSSTKNVSKSTKKMQQRFNW